MPRAPRFRIAEIDALCRQLRFAPRGTRGREMDSAELLINDIEPDTAYPHEFVIWRITGYRPEAAEAVTYAGAALIGDLATLVQELSADLSLPADYEGRRACSIDDAARRLGVSVKTIRRYRRRGLVFHYVRGSNGGSTLVCFEDALERFVTRHRAVVERAATFTRIGANGEGAIVDEARRLHETETLSLNEAARRIAIEQGRAHETIRNVLQRHDRRAATPIFGARGPLTDRDARLIERARRWGISIETIARRFGRSPSTIRRRLERHRAARLRRFELRWIDLPTFERDDAEAVILRQSAVVARVIQTTTTDGGRAEPNSNGDRTPLDEDTEHALVAGYNLLKRRAARAIDALPTWPAGSAVDRIETDLRWATRLKERLVTLGLPHAIRRVEHHAQRSFEVMSAEERAGYRRHAISVVGEVVEELDPTRGGRLDRLTAWAMDRALARIGDVRNRREVVVPLTPWTPVLGLDARQRERMAALDDGARKVVGLRYGLDAGPPQTIDAIADSLDRTPAAVMRILRRAERALGS